MIPENKKGLWCLYSKAICQEGECPRCETYLHRNDTPDEELEDI